MQLLHHRRDVCAVQVLKEQVINDEIVVQHVFVTSAQIHDASVHQESDTVKQRDSSNLPFWSQPRQPITPSSSKLHVCVGVKTPQFDL